MTRVAAIDCGTNSIRLLVADLTHRDDGSVWLRDVHREMRIVRLGQGVDATGMLAPEAIGRTRVALTDYVAIMRRKGAERVRMVATSATRDAGNRDDFFAMTREVLGVEAEVITGDEEARLSFIGAVGDLPPDDGPFLVTDIGGGSTEFVVGTWDGVKATIQAAKSVDIGCVRLTERALPDDPPSEEQIAKARKVADDVLAEAFDAVPVAQARTWVGVAGTVTTLSALVLNLPAYDSDEIHLSRLTAAGIRDAARRLLTVGHEERAAMPVLHPGRVDVIGGGALIVQSIAERLFSETGITELLASEHDILDGIALSISEPPDPE
ncbi:exopolyphosphatase / guanosine-5'-triphosphate,3'-diphosphate pyrophosphatase [Actinokineospora alba]|uniref:Exopolyphosphatase / guanosine-5'-triphosphate,3'-diphosphate pyrophosphatase n=1 Tax=Actinokineospora alba TaxID=504798 RepID=A0A1H0RY29_9PSEU|nr:Ppx/GppA phosphatase family protein [Actinokineospora alba]TDP66864.1 exopolyphosphatase/guanosine-5'-triphosphate,3'-diphosphate pyrophosphatase [Actinokineospora alba]SDI47932.1 exopolyphosphatase / guanosine-5'-triphosphate,3'-diphosphate pyrophosphatase [Actinokineospora alba]SDP34374.1 exopolyphosphatase / guanosine-5'-triphosphate,3'-diphosphate pyrophosphatase [Actinokineospora alba]